MVGASVLTVTIRGRRVAPTPSFFRIPALGVVEICSASLPINVHHQCCWNPPNEKSALGCVVEHALASPSQSTSHFSGLQSAWGASK